MPEIIEVTLYRFDELSDHAKEKARSWFRERIGDPDWYEFIYDDFESICRLLGIELRTSAVRLYGGGTREKPCIWFSGFWSQGDGACFEGRYRYRPGAVNAVRDHAPKDGELHRIARALQNAQKRNFYQLAADIRHRGRYAHSGSMEIDVERVAASQHPIAPGTEDEIVQALRDLADWLYRQLEREWEYQNSEECVDEGILANDYTFTADGARFR